MKRRAWIALSLCALLVCSPLYVSPFDSLSLERQRYEGDALLLDGYYHRTTKSGNIQVLFFYRNGVVLHGGDNRPQTFSETEERYGNGRYYEMTKDQETNWGLFRVDSLTIEFEMWYPGDAYWVPYVSSGDIVDDTTFRITKSFRSDGAKLANENKIFSYRSCAPKPDSIVSFFD